MEELMRGKIQAYYGTDTKKLYLGDCLELLRKMKPESVDMIFADPPYFLSNNGITCQGGRMVSVNKAGILRKTMLSTAGGSACAEGC